MAEILLSSYIYKEFETGSIAYDKREFVSRPIWSKNNTDLTAIYTSSIQSDTQKLYYLDIYNTSGSRAEKQFSIVYCDQLNSGSSSGSNGDNTLLESKTMYSQYKQLLLDSEKNLFEFMSRDGGLDAAGTQIDTYVESSDYVYVLNVARSRYKEKLAPGSWQISLNSMHPTLTETSQSKVVTLVDETLDQLYLFDNSFVRSGPAGQYYYVYSGSIKNGIYKGAGSDIPYGILYPDAGLILLNGKALDVSASIFTNRSPATASSSNNAFRLFTSISGAMSITPSHSFAGRTLETINSAIYFARVGNGEFNFSNNITYYESGSEQYVKPLLLSGPTRNNFYRNVTYITTVGLYNDERDLLAVAKLSKPIKKTSSSEVIIKIKLDY